MPQLIPFARLAAAGAASSSAQQRAGTSATEAACGGDVPGPAAAPWQGGKLLGRQPYGAGDGANLAATAASEAAGAREWPRHSRAWQQLAGPGSSSMSAPSEPGSSGSLSSHGSRGAARRDALLAAAGVADEERRGSKRSFTTMPPLPTANPAGEDREHPPGSPAAQPPPSYWPGAHLKPAAASLPDLRTLPARLRKKVCIIQPVSTAWEAEAAAAAGNPAAGLPPALEQQKEQQEDDEHSLLPQHGPGHAADQAHAMDWSLPQHTQWAQQHGGVAPAGLQRPPVNAPSPTPAPHEGGPGGSGLRGASRTALAAIEAPGPAMLGPPPLDPSCAAAVAATLQQQLEHLQAQQQMQLRQLMGDGGVLAQLLPALALLAAAAEGASAHAAGAHAHAQLPQPQLRPMQLDGAGGTFTAFHTQAMPLAPALAPPGVGSLPPLLDTLGGPFQDPFAALLAPQQQQQVSEGAQALVPLPTRAHAAWG